MQRAEGRRGRIAANQPFVNPFAETRPKMATKLACECQGGRSGTHDAQGKCMSDASIKTAHSYAIRRCHVKSAYRSSLTEWIRRLPMHSETIR